MFKKILVANRGEIALRVLRACRELEIRTVAVHSDVDRDSLHVSEADESFCIGPGPAGQSYLNIHNLISAALVARAEAIHPGYGFLAENPEFVEICQSHGLVFIGPSAQAMRQMGDKAEARRTVIGAGVPVLPGTSEISDFAEAHAFAAEFGFPVMIKAAAGGGGKGMRIALEDGELEKLFVTAQLEAEAAFGDGRIYLEKFLPQARHIEIQVLADGHGNVIHLGERDCSLQRRNQKLVEESPSPAVTPEKRAEMGAMAVAAAKSCGYSGVGTVEFLFDPRDQSFYFLEMNTRIQVEHPVTEFVTGLDLVKQQIEVAAGARLTLTQDQVVMRGAAIECRINAENPDEGFRPSFGRVHQVHFPGGPGVRIDSHLYSGYAVQPYYDSLLAKVISYGQTREEALSRMNRILAEMKVEGVSTTIDFQRRLIQHPRFRAGDVHTTFVEKEYLPEMLALV
ncbi:acetyl-CoA carboxylase biotin carboxylase subunit [bacterium]|nr:acetyl-CoA carboxylase biotin carboxylase subunit [bacterium]